ncbi:3-deoxy-D-manno-octulosonic acid transferase [Desulfobulbus elongatus]|uniref:3-deoxy-D-manno-octulosonic acid transferase n=1 Tax=Desulfobulbus elongatus TaxID=53332 RepID=UPI000A7D8AD4|nr:glycosyltransferase N-terminal domain-containing protein [Desulfobulbus elongatus]
MLHQLYSGLGAGLYPLLVLLRPLIEAIGGRFAYGIGQRLGRYPEIASVARPGVRTVWLHASSVGEVQAAIILAHALLDTAIDVSIVVSSTTEQGHRLASSRLPAATCILAPLDLPQAVRRALRAVRPDCYLCLETELWPVMLTEVRQAGIPMLLLNGRISQRSFRRYRRIRGFLAPLLDGFRQVAVISEADRERYAALGVPAARIWVCGNLKNDMEARSPDQVRAANRRRLGVDAERVFLCGSTHEGEEEQLLEVFRALAARGPAVWVIAPRHLERLPAVAALLRRAGMAFDLFSALAAQGRRANVVVVDTMGDLADLYAGGDYVFCGGSLVDRGGHNIVEAARWGRAVYFGPHMKDFQDAADTLVQAGGGFRVADARELTALLLAHVDAPDEYATACARAADMAAGQRGAVARQAALVREVLAAR